MGSVDAFPVDEEMAGGSSGQGAGVFSAPGASARYQLIVVLVAALIFVGCMISPPSLMDDVDAVQGQIARNMLQSGDWVTARLDGVAYLEKSPLKYWLIAVSFAVFGPYDWAARIPLAFSTVLLCWVTSRFASWAFGRQVGLWSGLAMATSIGLFLFTRILIPDVMLTLTITVALWSLMRALDDEERRPGAWAMLMWAALGTGLLLKGLIALVFPAAAGALGVITYAKAKQALQTYMTQKASGKMANFKDLVSKEMVSPMQMSRQAGAGLGAGGGAMVGAQATQPAVPVPAP